MTPGLIALWCGLALAGAPNYAAFSEPDGLIKTEAQERAAFAMLHDPEQVDALYADAAKGNVRAAHVVEQLEATLAATGRKMADAASEPDCLVPVAHVLSLKCKPIWTGIDYLSQERPGGIKLRAAMFRAFAVRARERGMENQLILSVVNGLLAVTMASAVLAMVEGEVGTVANVQRLRPPEVETGKRLSRKLGVPLAESPHVGTDFVDPSGKTYEAMGVPRASTFWNQKDFLKSIDDHFLKSADFVVIDMTGFSQEQINIVRQYLSKLPPQQLAKLIQIGF